MRAAATLGIAALALAGVVGLEVAGGPDAVKLPGLLAHPPAMHALPPESTEAWRRVLLARPLFSPGRRPPANAGGATLAGLPRLTGVLVAPSGRHAIFAGGVVLAEGARIGRYRVRRIEAGQVTLSGPDGPHVVRPQFAALATSATAPAPRAPPAPPVTSPLREPK